MKRITNKQLACVLREAATWVRTPKEDLPEDAPGKTYNRLASNKQRRHVDPLSEQAENFCAIGYVLNTARMDVHDLDERLGVTMDRGYRWHNVNRIIDAFDSRRLAECANIMEEVAGKIEKRSSRAAK